MKNYNRLLFLVFLVFNSLFYQQIQGQNGYNITVQVNNIKDSSLLMTCYYGNKIKLVDTAYLSNTDSFIFSGKEPLPGGIYMVVTPAKSKLFEFIIGNQQNFKLQTDTLDYAGHMKIKRSEENKAFYQYLHYNETIYQQSKLYASELKKLPPEDEKTKQLKSSIDSLNTLSIAYKEKIINENTHLFVSRLLNAMREVEIPDTLRKSTDSLSTFNFYKNHYWDNFNLSDSCLLRTPLISKKLNQYMENVVFFHPDSVTAAIDTLINKARPSNEMVSYLVWHFMSEYQNPKYMGFDKIFVHIADNYFAKEEIQNTTPSVLKMLHERADIVRPILIGQTAPNMILLDTSGQLKSMNTIESNFLVIVFWDYDCGICKHEIEDLKTLYLKSSDSIEVLGICVNSDLDKWKEALKERKMPWISVNGTRSATADFHDLYDIHGTPVIYVLDKEKKIIAKRIGAAQIEELIENYEKTTDQH